MEARITIGGMSCGGCTAAVSRALQAQAGVQQVEVSLAPPEARVVFDPSQTDPARLRQAVEAAGFGAPV